MTSQISTLVRAELTQSAGERTLVRAELTQSAGERTLVRAELTQSAGERTLVRAELTQSAGERTLVRAELTQSAGERTLVRAELTQSAGERTLISILNLEKYSRGIIENKYNLFVCDNNKMLELFEEYIINYSKQNKRIKTYVGIDFEFNKRKIALMQINFGESIWLLNPAQFNDHMKNNFVRKILLNKQIYKILHGSDSLDLPYIFTELMDGHKNHIISFTKRLLDTRFLCEYFCTSVNVEKHCSIYDTLLFFDVIDKNKYDDLENINASMGPIFTISWNINKFNNSQLKYAYYDVVYLKDLVFKIMQKAKKDTPQFFNSYNYISSIIRLILLNKKGIISFEPLKIICDKMNNYSIIREYDMTLISLFDKFIETLRFDEFDVRNILGVSYLKNDFIILVKYLFYCNISNKIGSDIYINKNVKLIEKPKKELLQEYIDIFVKVKKLFENIDNFIQNNLDKYI